MSTFEQIKKQWDENHAAISGGQTYDASTMEKVIKTRTKKHKNTVMQYFWASFTLQVLVYALLSHVVVRYGSDIETLLYCVAGILLFLPFTITLMRKFKQMAVNNPQQTDPTRSEGTSLYIYVLRQYTLLRSFYQFKKRYELLLIPLSTAIGTILVFNLYVPGGAAGHETGVVITFLISLLSCVFAIRSENQKSFEQPLHQLHETLKEFQKG